MKKIALFLVLAVSVMLAVSCKSSQRVTDDTFRAIYNKYYDDLILEGAKEYTVKSGDTLAQISNTLYGDGYYYPVIMLASKNVVLDQDRIRPGMTLVVPVLQTNLDRPQSRAAVKGVLLDCAKIEDNRGRKNTAAGLRDHADKL
jgi:Tfp pilus assembly protein FimV